MGNRSGFRLVVVVLMVVVMLAGVAAYSYNVGVAHGIAESGRFLAVPGNAAPGSAVPLIAVWPRPWGFGFGFFPFFPLFFVLFWILVLRGLFWRPAWWVRGYGYRGVPPTFDEWHRRAHAHAQQAPPASDPRL
jgi:hypothetical protein